MLPESDPELLQDFLTEAAELIEQFDSDLVRLEQSPSGPDARELLNSLFRALHTVKGAASFLGLESLTSFAHAAEDALNRLRRGEVAVTPAVIDALLQAGDVLRSMIDALSARQSIDDCPPALMAQLHAIANMNNEERASGDSSTDALRDSDVAEQSEPAALSSTPQTAPLRLPQSKVELLPFMLDDLEQACQQIADALTLAGDADARERAAMQLGAEADNVRKIADFLELNDLVQLSALLCDVSVNLTAIGESPMMPLLCRLHAVHALLLRYVEAMRNDQVPCCTIDKLVERTRALAAGQTLEPHLLSDSTMDVQAILLIDGVEPGTAPISSSDENPVQVPAASRSTDEGAAADQAPEESEAAAAANRRDDRRLGERRVLDRRAAPTSEQTIRVEVGRLETLLNLVGQMVLTKNRVLAINRKLREVELEPAILEDVTGAANDLDRLTSNLQVAVMRTRMQPLAKLFERYPRVIRDIARATGKKINLEIVGKETEVDKSVLELLADPLVHILRNSADHGIEQPEVRQEAGKSATGTIRLSAEHQGSHVRVVISDDGKGLDRDVIGRKAVQRGLATDEQVANMPDHEVFQYIFVAGFSTAEQVSDLSGRGVGMDVVRTNVAKMNGSINIQSVKGQGSSFEILIPLTVAIMPAMVVGVGMNTYCVPLQSIIEIVRPTYDDLHSMRGQPVMRLRDSVLPLLNLREALGEPAADDSGGFAVVVGVGDVRAGLIVDRLVGQQEIVIKPLDDGYSRGGPFSGATIQEDGAVSLILDVVQLIREAQVGESAVERLAA